MFLSNHPVFDLLLRATLLGPIALLWVTATVRCVGLRAFSKMAAVDFVATVATGSLLAGAATADTWTAFLQANLSMCAVLAMQAVITALRERLPWVSAVIDNSPVVLMVDGVLDRAALRLTRVTENDVRAKLREANVLERGAVRAVVLEATGDVSVLHGEHLDDELLPQRDGLDSDETPAGRWST